MIKIAVAPVSTIACGIVGALLVSRRCSGAPDMVRPVAAIPVCVSVLAGTGYVRRDRVVLDITIVMSSSFSVPGRILRVLVGIGVITNAQFILSATCFISAPNRHNPAGN